MFSLVTTADLVDALYFLKDPLLTPNQPKCKRCSTELKQFIKYSEENIQNDEEPIEIFWVCPICKARCAETDGQQL
jgi:hypothetical protein